MVARREQSHFLGINHYHLFPQAKSQLKSFHLISDHAHCMTRVSFHRDHVPPMIFCHRKRPLEVWMSDDSHLVVHLRDPTCLHKPCLSARLLALMRDGHLDLIMMNSGYHDDRLGDWNMFKRTHFELHLHYLYQNGRVNLAYLPYWAKSAIKVSNGLSKKISATSFLPLDTPHMTLKMM
jgi:hypothetical protein